MKNILFLTLTILGCISCSQSSDHDEKEKFLEKREKLLYENSLIYPKTVTDAANIFKEGEGNVRDALLIFESQATKQEVKILEDFLNRVKAKPEEYKAHKYNSPKDKGLEAWCSRIIKVLESPDLKKYQYEFNLEHVLLIEHAREVLKVRRGDFYMAFRRIRLEGKKEDIPLLKSTIKLSEEDSEFKEKLQKAFSEDIYKEINSIIIDIQKRSKDESSD